MTTITQVILPLASREVLLEIYHRGAKAIIADALRLPMTEEEFQAADAAREACRELVARYNY